MTISVLIVDDVEIMRAGVRAQLEQTGLPLRVAGEASSGEEALLLLQREPVDLLITDIRMARLDGMKLIEAAKERHPDLLFIVLTGHPLFDYAREALRLGVVDFLLKPLKTAELKQALLKGMAQIRERQENCLVKWEADLNSWLHNAANADSFPSELPIPRQPNLYYSVILAHLYDCRPFPANMADSLQSHPGGGTEERRGRLWKNLNQEREQFAIVWDAEEERLQERCARLAAEWERAVREAGVSQFAIAYGEPGSGLCAIHRSFHRARQLLDLRWHTRKRNVFEPSCWSDSGQIPVIHVDAEAERFKSWIGSHNRDAAALHLSRLFRTLMADSLYGRRVFIRLLDMIWEIGNMLGIHHRSLAVNLSEVSQRLDEMYRADEMSDYLQGKLFLLFEQPVEDQHETQQLAQKIVDYIRTNIGKELTRDGISAHFALHPNYLSTWFREKTGGTLMDTIHRIKIEFAKQLLLETPYTIGTIAGMVGMEHSYFCKIFKRASGQSPAGFRSGAGKEAE